MYLQAFFSSAGQQSLYLKSEDQINKYFIIFFLNLVELEASGKILDLSLSSYWIDNGTNIFLLQRWTMKRSTSLSVPPWPDCFCWDLGRVPSRGSSSISDTSSSLEAFCDSHPLVNNCLPHPSRGQPENLWEHSNNLTEFNFLNRGSSAPPGG